MNALNLHTTRRLALLAGLSCSFAGPAVAKTLDVGKGGPFETIQAAVDAAAAGDRIRVAAGVYSEVVVVPLALTGLQIDADGPAVLDARGPGGAALGPALTLFAAGVRVDGLTVRHAASIPANGSGAGVVVAGSDVVLRDLTVDHCEKEGIFVKGEGVRILDCVVRGTEVGIAATGPDLLVKSTVVRGCGKGGILASGARTRVIRCELIANGIAGVSVHGDESVVRKNVLDGNGRGIDAAADLVRIERNVIRWTLSDALTVEGTGATIERNTIDATSFVGLEVQGDSVTIADNEIRFTGRDSIAVSGDGASVERNVIREGLDRTYGISVFGAQATIVENDVRDAIGIIAISNSDAEGGLSAGNDVRRVAGAGVQTFGADSILLENAVRSAGLQGITLLGTNGTAEGNSVRACLDGVRLQGSGHVVRANAARDCRVDGIHVELVTAGKPPHLVTDNLVLRCRGEGIEVNAAGTTVSENVCLENRLDLASNAAGVVFVGNDFTTGGPATPPEIE